MAAVDPPPFFQRPRVGIVIKGMGTSLLPIYMVKMAHVYDPSPPPHPPPMLHIHRRGEAEEDPINLSGTTNICFTVLVVAPMPKYGTGKSVLYFIILLSPHPSILTSNYYLPDFFGLRPTHTRNTKQNNLHEDGSSCIVVCLEAPNRNF